MTTLEPLATDHVTGDDPWARLAADLDLPEHAPPVRRWVQSPNAGHISGLIWGATAPRVVIVHDFGDSANGWDLVALASGLPLVAIDLPGHGRSSVARTVEPPARQASALIDGIRSLAPQASLVVASGFGAAVALHAAARRPATVRAVLVVDGGTVAAGLTPLADPAGFADQASVAARLASAAPLRPAAFHRHLAREATAPDNAGRFAWRHSAGELPDGFATWLRLGALARPTVPVAVATASSEPSDPTARDVVSQWADIDHIQIDAPSGTSDLAATAPAAVAAAITTFLARLEPTQETS